MRHTGVSCAFAIDDQRGIVVGLITAYDIVGEKPMQYMRSAAMTHVPVMETSDAGEQRLRGLVSAAKVKRLLSRPESVRHDPAGVAAALRNYG